MVKNRWFHYLIGGVLGLLLYLSLSWIIWLPLKPLYHSGEIILKFLSINLSFIPMVLAVILIVKFYHKIPILFFINSDKKINFKRFYMGFILWLSIQILTTAYTYFFDRESIIYTYDINRSLKIFLLSLILTPIQIAGEEFLFRGYLINLFKSIKNNKVVPIIGSATLFALPHLANPEVKGNIVIFLFIYLSMALLFSYLTVTYNGLEYSFGIHLANNFYAINFLNYPNSPLPTTPLFTLNSEIDPLGTLIQTVIFSTLIVIIIKKIENNSYQKQKK